VLQIGQEAIIIEVWRQAAENGNKVVADGDEVGGERDLRGEERYQKIEDLMIQPPPTKQRDNKPSKGINASSRG